MSCSYFTCVQPPSTRVKATKDAKEEKGDGRGKGRGKRPKLDNNTNNNVQIYRIFDTLLLKNMNIILIPKRDILSEARHQAITIFILLAQPQ